MKADFDRARVRLILRFANVLPQLYIWGHIKGNRLKETLESKPVGILQNFLRLRTLLGFAVSGIVLYLFFRNFDFSEALSAISRARWPYILISFIVYYATVPIRGIRWGRLLRPAGYNIDNSLLTKYYFISWFVNAILPAKAGDFYRAYLLKKAKGVSISLSLGVLFSERIIDLVIVAALMISSGAFFLSTLRGTPESDSLIFGLMVVILAAVFFMAVAFGLPRLIKYAPHKWQDRLKLFSSGIFKTPALIPIIILMTMAIWLSEALRLFFVFRAFGIEAGFLTAVFISQVALLVIAIPLSPAGLGLVEILMLKIMTSTGVLSDVAGAVTMVDRMISYWSLLILGAITYLATGDR